MTVKQGQARIVGDKVHFRFLIASKHHNIFENSRGGLSRQTRQLEAVPVQMDRMEVIAGIAHTESIPLAVLQMKCSCAYFASHRVSDAIDGPSVEAVLRGIVFREGHFEGLVWWRRGCARFRETCVVPLERRRRNPLRFPGAPGVLHNNAHAVAAIIICEVSQNPDACMSHMYNGRDSLCCAKPQHRNRSWIRNGIAVEGDNLEGVTRQRQAANLGGASIEDVKQDAFALPDLDRLAVAEHASVDGEGSISYFVAVRHSFGERRVH